MNLRQWQADALDRYLAEDKQDFLAVVTPGAGKTRWGGVVAMSLKDIERLIVVCPSTSVKKQWEDEMAKEHFGVKMSDLDRCDSNHLLTTYQQVASRPEDFKELVEELPSLVIFDEVHHASEKNSWGELARGAFVAARKRLALTGTAFRSDNDPIPFVSYENGVCVPDFVYGYRQAVRDGICREIIPHVFHGELGWLREGETEEKFATFADALKKTDRRDRLRAALEPEGGFMKSMLTAADARLSEYPGEGGLVICQSTGHANRVARVLQELTGVKPVVVHSKLSNPHKRIEAFRENSERWLVSVQMVSEGVDIERLRVLVYAHNIETELFLRQAVGRVVRRTGQAHVYFPAHEPFVKVIDEIEEDRVHGIEDRDEGTGGGGGGGPAKGIEVLHSEGWEVDIGVRLESRLIDEHGEMSGKVKEIDERQREKVRGQVHDYYMKNRDYLLGRSLERYHQGKKKEHDPAPVRERYRQDPEFRNKQIKACRLRYQTDGEYRERQLARMRERYHSDPEYRRRKNGRHDPEFRKRKNRKKRETYHAKKLFQTEEAKTNGWDLKKCREIIRERMKSEPKTN